MAKTKGYTIIVDECHENVEDAVWVLLRKGWELHGAPFVRLDKFCQAMIKRGRIHDDETKNVEGSC